jgi:hypothetical protein
VVAEQTVADEAGFVLTLRTTTAKATTGSALLIAGGDPARTTVEANKPGGTGALIEALTIRGQAGTIASSGFGATLAWIEDGVPYSVSGGNLNREQIIEFAEALETVDLNIWRQRAATANGHADDAIDTGERATRLLALQAAQDKLYPNPACLTFAFEQLDVATFDIAVREKQDEPCGGDPGTAPVIDRYRVVGDGTILWLNERGEYVAYQYARAARQHS